MLTTQKKWSIHKVRGVSPEAGSRSMMRKICGRGRFWAGSERRGSCGWREWCVGRVRRGSLNRQVTEVRDRGTGMRLRELRSWFQTRAYGKERSVIRREDDVGDRARIMRDEERVLRGGWTEMRLCRYGDWPSTAGILDANWRFVVVQTWPLTSLVDLQPHHHHHNRFMALFPGPPGWAGARRELLDFMEQAKINSHSICKNQVSRFRHHFSVGKWIITVIATLTTLFWNVLRVLVEEQESKVFSCRLIERDPARPTGACSVSGVGHTPRGMGACEAS